MSLALSLRHDAPLLDFHAEIPEGAMTALVGPSGSGKTSILRAVAGLLRVRHGRIALGPEVWDDDGRVHLRTRERPIGLVPQHYGLFPHMTAQGNVEAALSHLAGPERRARAAACLALAHADGLDGRYPRELSGGQKQRVALARAIARAPRVLLLDEPFSAVDRSTRKRLYVELRRLHEQLKATVVLVTHDLEEAAQLASHVCLIQHGRLLQSGPTPEVLTRPCCEEAARMLDIPNVFDGTVEAAPFGRGVRLRWGPHTLSVANLHSQQSGQALQWAILPHNVLMVRPDKPWSSHLENPVPATVVDLIELGAEVTVWLRPHGLADTLLQMRLPLRAMRRYAVVRGQEVSVCLRTSDIVPMPTAGEQPLYR